MRGSMHEGEKVCMEALRKSQESGTLGRTCVLVVELFSASFPASAQGCERSARPASHSV